MMNLLTGTMTLTPEDLLDVLIHLQVASSEIIVVGGQAVNLWATHYAQETESWQRLRPYASRDIDFFGSRLEVITCAAELQGKAYVNRDFDSSPNTGIVTIPYRNQTLTIDFLATVFGISDDDIVATAVEFKGEGRLEGLQLKVLNPLLCLEGKLKSLLNLPQADRQDAKHCRLSILILREYLKDICQELEPRPGLKVIERILRLGGTEAALNAWYHLGVSVESTIPLSQIQTFQHPIWQKFLELRWSQSLGHLQNRRERYQQITEQIEYRRSRPEG
jgi:hypothetical protein